MHAHTLGIHLRSRSGTEVSRRFPIHTSRCGQASLLEELERVGSAELAGGTLPARAVVAEGGRAAAALLGTLLDEPVRRISCYAASMRAPLETLHLA